MPEWFTQLIAPLGVGIAVYAGIRVDLAIAKSQAARALESADHAHGRIDRLMENPQRHLRD